MQTMSESAVVVVIFVSFLENEARGELYLGAWRVVQNTGQKGRLLLPFLERVVVRVAL
jgi:hypothetical protein